MVIRFITHHCLRIHFRMWLTANAAIGEHIKSGRKTTQLPLLSYTNGDITRAANSWLFYIRPPWARLVWEETYPRQMWFSIFPAVFSGTFSSIRQMAAISESHQPFSTRAKMTAAASAFSQDGS